MPSPSLFGVHISSCPVLCPVSDWRMPKAVSLGILIHIKYHFVTLTWKDSFFFFFQKDRLSSITSFWKCTNSSRAMGHTYVLLAMPSERWCSLIQVPSPQATHCCVYLKVPQHTARNPFFSSNGLLFSGWYTDMQWVLLSGSPGRQFLLSDPPPCTWKGGSNEPNQTKPGKPLMARLSFPGAVILLFFTFWT